MINRYASKITLSFYTIGPLQNVGAIPAALLSAPTPKTSTTPPATSATLPDPQATPVAKPACTLQATGDGTEEVTVPRASVPTDSELKAIALAVAPLTRFGGCKLTNFSHPFTLGSKMVGLHPAHSTAEMELFKDCKHRITIKDWDNYVYLIFGMTPKWKLLEFDMHAKTFTDAESGKVTSYENFTSSIEAQANDVTPDCAIQTHAAHKKTTVPPHCAIQTRAAHKMTTVAPDCAIQTHAAIPTGAFTILQQQDSQDPSEALPASTLNYLDEQQTGADEEDYHEDKARPIDLNVKSCMPLLSMNIGRSQSNNPRRRGCTVLADTGCLPN